MPYVKIDRKKFETAVSYMQQLARELSAAKVTLQRVTKTLQTSAGRKATGTRKKV